MYKVRVKREAQPRSAPADVITIKEAAEILGVSEMTLRRWDKSGKFRARRHPLNDYRIYSRRRVLELQRRIIGRAA
jgi:excisionase family DNA binding protein